MSSPSPTPFNWLKTFPSSLLRLDQTPLMGNPPSFPWEELQEKLREVLQTQELSLKPGEMAWKETSSLSEGLGGDLLPLHISISPLKGTFSWLMSKQSYEHLFAILAKAKRENFTHLAEDYVKGFSQFLAVEILHIFESLNYDKDLSFQLSKDSSLLQEDALCSDLTVQLGDAQLLGRAVFSSELQKSWKGHYAKQIDLQTNPSLANKLPITVHLEVGHTTIKRKELLELRPGDLLLLNTCSYKPKEQKGRVTLTAQGVPLFRTKLKQGNLKIVGFPLYREVETAMGAKMEGEYNEEELEESEEELEEHGEELEEYEEEREEELVDVEEEEEEEELEDEETTEEDELEDEETTEEDELEDEETTEEEHELEDEETTEEDELEDEETTEEEDELEDEEEHEETTEEETAPLPVEEKRMVSPKDMPLSVVVEVGRLQMSMQKLMELQPGNVLEISLQPENGVDLVIDNNKIARGELVQVGDLLGVRIIDIG